jgi:adenine phosphoribosyltransferase
MLDLAPFIRDIPDFPQPGIAFKDISPLLADPTAFAASITQLSEPFRDREIDLVAGLEARGFLFGPSVAQVLNVGFVPMRKPGKLPADTTAMSYELEYGTDSIEVHTDAIAPGARVLLVDDVLATGGTLAAAVALVESLDGIVAGASLLLELAFLDGRASLGGIDVHAALEVT